MAINNNGPFGGHNGKLGRLVYYNLNGQEVSRTIGRTTKPPTLPQLKSRLITSVTSKFLSLLNDYVTVGFGILAQGTTKNAYNLAYQANRKYITTGEYPDLELVYENVVLSQGTLKSALNPKTSLTAEGIRFDWDVPTNIIWQESTDQVMLLAYFPDTEYVITSLFGASRITGTELLKVPEPLLTERMETYLSFVSADRKAVSDSLYTGHFNR